MRWVPILCLYNYSLLKEISNVEKLVEDFAVLWLLEHFTHFSTEFIFDEIHITY